MSRFCETRSGQLRPDRSVAPCTGRVRDTIVNQSGVIVDNARVTMDRRTHTATTDGQLAENGRRSCQRPLSLYANQRSQDFAPSERRSSATSYLARGWPPCQITCTGQTISHSRGGFLARHCPIL